MSLKIAMKKMHVADEDGEEEKLLRQAIALSLEDYQDPDLD